MSFELQETSIQYEIKQCNYHPLLKNVTDCKVIGEVVANPSNRIQSTLQSKESIFPVTPKLPTNRDVVIKITPIALNSERGPSEMTTVRLDPLSGKIELILFNPKNLITTRRPAAGFLLILNTGYLCKNM